MAKVVMVADGYLHIPPEIQKDVGFHPVQPVLVRTEGERLIVEKPSQRDLAVEIEKLCPELRTGEPLPHLWTEIEQEREEAR